jgi:hypothetical protein
MKWVHNRCEESLFPSSKGKQTTKRLRTARDRAGRWSSTDSNKGAGEGAAGGWGGEGVEQIFGYGGARPPAAEDQLGFVADRELFLFLEVMEEKALGI